MLLLAAVAIGVLSGSLTGVLLGLRLARRPRAWLRMGERVSIDPLADEQIRTAAREWAAAQGRPEAAELVTKKARLLYRLNARRRARGWRSW